MFSQAITTPIGPIQIIATDKAIIEINLTPSKLNQTSKACHPFEACHPELDSGSNLTKTNHLTQQAAKQLQDYFKGILQTFHLPLAPHGTPFQLSVWQQLQAIPFGQTKTYGDIARALHNPKAVRAVGGANGRNPIPIIIPCHRVVASNGLGGYSGGLDKKQWLLRHEDYILKFGIISEKPRHRERLKFTVNNI